MEDRWILDDAERALLVALRAHDIGPMESVSADALCAKATHDLGFESDRLGEALRSLGEKGLVEPLGDGRVRLSTTGFLHVHQTP